MMVLQAVEDAERALTSQLQFLTRAIDGDADERQSLQFTADEEQIVEDRLSDAIATLERTINAADDKALEMTDPHAMADTRERLSQHREAMKTHRIGVRKVLVAYRQKAKAERLQQARNAVMHRDSKEGSRKSTTSSGSAVDVTAALRRTRKVMTDEIERVGSVSKVLDDGRVALKSSHEEFDSVNTEIAEVRKRLKALQWQARQDRMWIAAGIAVLAATVAYIIHERTGLLII
ncbi:hypothetical protein ATCC90586_000076 [Pythium insidiosum]|nr:hypothetical protein ATCC90586_000076 [Pythium insidiosum]